MDKHQFIVWLRKKFAERIREGKCTKEQAYSGIKTAARLTKLK